MSASVTVQHTWPDGQVSAVTVTVQASYPDALSEARATAVAALREVVADMGEDEGG